MRLWKQAVRQLFRSPGFLTVAALALALGIGSTTTIFSIVRAVNELSTYDISLY